MKVVDSDRIEGDRHLAQQIVEEIEFCRDLPERPKGPAWLEFERQYGKQLDTIAGVWSKHVAYLVKKKPENLREAFAGQILTEADYQQEAFEWILYELRRTELKRRSHDKKKKIWFQTFLERNDHISLEDYLWESLRRGGHMFVDFLRVYVKRPSLPRIFKRLTEDESAIHRNRGRDSDKEISYEECREIAATQGWPPERVQEACKSLRVKLLERRIFKKTRKRLDDDRIIRELGVSSERLLAGRIELGGRLVMKVRLPQVRGLSNEVNEFYDLLRRPRAYESSNKGTERNLDMLSAAAGSPKKTQQLRNQIYQRIAGDRNCIPRCLHQCAEETRQLFVMWRLGFSEDLTAEQLGITVHELFQAKQEIFIALCRKNERQHGAKTVELDEARLFEETESDDKLDAESLLLIDELHAGFKRAWQRLTEDQRLVLWLFYVEELTDREILEAYKTAGRSLLPKKATAQATTKNIDKVIEKARTKLLQLFKQEYPEWPEGNMDIDNLIALLKLLERKRNESE